MLELAGAVEEILTDNKLPFFPAYTDHSAAHVKAVLDAGERLIPDEVWESGLLQAADAAVLIGAACLHDLALHIREPGFVALTSEDSVFQPLSWFDADQRGRPADKPWPELWREFQKEARNFTQSELDRLFGPQAAVPDVAFEKELKPGDWTNADRLLIGEFIRRHHARLSHEIAIFGFPGKVESEFPVLAKTLTPLADAIGVTARSHNEDLRVVAEYLQYKQPGDLRPDGAILLYLMGVLRIADYFQLEASRASPLLLHLREPQSPQSIEEWSKHQAIQRISWEHKDPLAVNVQISPTHGIRTYLQLVELIDDLQRELDVTTAVLGEAFGASELAPLRLSRQRIHTNLHEPSLHQQLGFVPRHARLRSAEDLFRLVISDLYGNHPEVAGRELLQNSVDAVRELEHWKALNGVSGNAIELRDLPADVLVEERIVGEDTAELRVVDRGIGMTPTTVIESFLTAGASFRPIEQEEQPLEPATAIRWMKAGRFGVGVFASFLLGSEVHVTTRHVAATRGVSFTARLDDDLTQLDWVDDVPVGTEITIPFSRKVLERSSRPARFRRLYLLAEIASYYQLRTPRVAFRLIRQKGIVREFNSTGQTPTPGERLPVQWQAVPAADFDAVLWQLPVRESEKAGVGSGRIVHNGIAIERAGERPRRRRAYRWSDPWIRRKLHCPNVSVFDTRQLLGITLNRYELVDGHLPFEDRLLYSVGEDVVAHALTRGAHPYPLGLDWSMHPVVGRQQWFPLLAPFTTRYVDRSLCVLWVSDRVRKPTAGRFLRGRTSGGRWKDLPLRLALRPSSTPDVRRERERWGLAYTDVLRAVGQMSNFGLRPTVGTFVQARQSSEGSRVTSLEPDCPPPRWVEGHAGSLMSHIEFSDDPPDPDLKATLTEIGLELLAGQEDSSLALTVFYPTGKPPSAHESLLAAPWIDAIGGGLERSQAGREARKSEVVEMHPEIGRLVEKWEPSQT